MTAMRAGAFATAWQISDEVLRRRVVNRGQWWRLPRHQQPVWTGEHIDGRRVLVRCYHGLGDSVQFLRFARILRERAREVIFWIQPELVELANMADGVDQALPLHDGRPQCAFDVDLEVMELAHALRADAAMLKPGGPYLFVPAEIAPRDGALHIGFAWRSGGWDPRRNLPIALASSLLNIAGIRWVSLLPHGAEGDPLGIGSLADGSVTGLARSMRNLDLVITVDTFAAHLAGALGVRTWTLLHAECDWRWGARDIASLWYPSMRLFRQQEPGDWHPVMRQVFSSLTAMARLKKRD